MKLLHIDPGSCTIEEIELKVEANTFYTFFRSLLIDELPTLANHTIYTDANALSQNKLPYFIGEQIVVGEALILGRDGFKECDVRITSKQLEPLVNYDVSAFYKEALMLLGQTDANLYRAFEVVHEGKSIDLNIAWVLYFFNIADSRTKEYFLDALQKTIRNGEAIETFMEKMAKAALKAAG